MVEAGDPLVMLDKLVDWEQFWPTLETIRSKTPKSKGGRKPYDAVMMFKILILQSLYGLSDAQMQYQILDRLSFMKFLGLTLGDYRKAWTNAQVIEPLFEQFVEFLHNNGYVAKRAPSSTRASCCVRSSKSDPRTPNPKHSLHQRKPFFCDFDHLSHHPAKKSWFPEVPYNMYSYRMNVHGYRLQEDQYLLKSIPIATLESSTLGMGILAILGLAKKKSK